MFELEEYSTGFHDGFLNKYADSSRPTLDFYISDSLQDMLDIDIRSEVANVVGSVSDYDNCLGDLPSSLEHSTDSLSLLNSSTVVKDSANSSSWNSTSAFGLGSSNSSSSWFGANNDFLADVGACVNPISVMPLISSSLIHMSPKTNLNANVLHSNSPPPPSPNVSDTKSHLTFSPAHIKISSNSIRNEQISSHIPKQIVPISSSVTSATSAPATLATNSALQRKSVAVDAIRKDLGPDLKKVIPISSSNENVVFKTNPVAFGSNQVSNNNNTSKSTISTFSGNNSVHQNGNISSSNNNNNSSTSHSNNNNNSSFFNGGSASSSTIKLGPGIGGLTFANNITYNKLKQQSITKTSTAATITSNGTIVLKRDRDSSPMQSLNSLNNSTNNGQHVGKILSRSSVQASSSFTPKSIASSAHHNSHAHQQQQHQHQQQQQHNSSMINSVNLNSNGNASHTTVSVTNTIHSGLGSGGVFASSGVSSTNIIAVKPLQQKIKSTPVESEFPKPAYSYSCLIAMALKNSRRGSLPVSEIYSFMCEHFPYFKTAPSGWKNSVRHNLSLNKCFEKIEKPPTNGNQRKGCLWAMNPERIAKMDEEVQKWSRKDPMAIRNAMVCPDNLEALERGEMKHGSSGDSDTEMDSQSEIEEASDMEEQELDETLVDNMLVEEDVDDDIHSAASHIEDDNDDNDVCEVVNKNTLHTTNSSSPLTIASTKVKLNNLPATCNTNSNIPRDFDIEVEDIYDAIDIDDDKEAVRMAISQSDIIELSPADYNISGERHQSPKRARLNVNYSLGPSGDIENQFQNQQQLQIQTIKKIVKVQSVHDLQQIQQQLQQHHQQQMIVHSITTNNSVNNQHQQLSQQGNGQFSQIGSIPSTINDNLNRRK